MKIVSFMLGLLLTANVFAAEKIYVQYGAAASQSNFGAYLKMLDVANTIQDRYQFVLEIKPGANGVIALKALDQSPENRIAGVAPAFIENANSGLINDRDYVPVAASGDTCWGVITNVGDTAQGVASLRGQKEITVGGTGYGNAAHLTSLVLGRAYGFKVRYIVYKSNYDALRDMSAGLDINFVIETVQNYQTFKARNPKLQLLGINCPKRVASVPEIKTIKEQGFDTPSIFFGTVAHVKMPAERRKEINKILNEATVKTVADLALVDIIPPQSFNPPMDPVDFLEKRWMLMRVLTHQFAQEINSAK
jgi:tripartite-type tricarboxylate transporter receptor subunit TctC